jgi:hypothetical protein
MQTTCYDLELCRSISTSVHQNTLANTGAQATAAGPVKNESDADIER